MFSVLRLSPCHLSSSELDFFYVNLCSEIHPGIFIGYGYWWHPLFFVEVVVVCLISVSVWVFFVKCLSVEVEGPGVVVVSAILAKHFWSMEAVALESPLDLC